MQENASFKIIMENIHGTPPVHNLSERLSPHIRLANVHNVHSKVIPYLGIMMTGRCWRDLVWGAVDEDVFFIQDNTRQLYFNMLTLCLLRRRLFY